VVCCYARQAKHWVTGPDGQRWENYVVLADAEAAFAEAADDRGCCGTDAPDAAVPDGSSCCA
jgi:hypothetical protein